MDRLDRLIDRHAPLSLDADVAAASRAFEDQPTAQVLAVVDADCRPVGLLRRQAFEAAVLSGTAPVASVMDLAPLVVDGGMRPSRFRDEMLAGNRQALAAGFIVTEDGLYLGVGTAVNLLAAHGERSRALRDATVATTQVLAAEVLRQLGDAQTFVDALVRQPLPADSKSCAQALADSFADLHRLLHRASAIQATEAGLVPLNPRPTLLRAVIDALDARWSARAATAGVTLLTAYDGAPDLAAEIDADRLADLLDGLVERGLSATRRGAVEVTLSARPALEGLALEARVRDAGETPDPARLARIFQALDGEQPLAIAFGMAHAASLAGAMNGLIRAEANAGSGTSVVFSLLAPEAVEAVAAPAPGMIAASAAHILIVDDNATNRMVAEALCEMFDCTSEQAEDGVEAVEMATIGRYDLILMDIKMPRMDGVAATRAIRALAGPAGLVPIVALTANADPSDVRDYIAAGMNDVVEKPIKAERLLTVFDKVLNGDRQAAAEQSSTAA
ncbi:MAG: response regulator [Caulobacteraceae bacterium]|nr:MAG: response regulator [Caulobacteraceae bacterium]